jgi:hypothetical protein
MGQSFARPPTPSPGGVKEDGSVVATHSARAADVPMRADLVDVSTDITDVHFFADWITLSGNGSKLWLVLKKGFMLLYDSAEARVRGEPPRGGDYVVLADRLLEWRPDSLHFALSPREDRAEALAGAETRYHRFSCAKDVERAVWVGKFRLHGVAMHNILSSLIPW